MLERYFHLSAHGTSVRTEVLAGVTTFLTATCLAAAFGSLIMGLIANYPIALAPGMLVTLGDLTAPAPLLAAAGFFVMVALDRRGVAGAILIGILATTVVGIALGASSFRGVLSVPPSLAPTLLQMDVAGALEIGLVSIVFTFLFVDLFDTAGTLVGVPIAPGF